MQKYQGLDLWLIAGVSLKGQVVPLICNELDLCVVSADEWSMITTRLLTLVATVATVARAHVHNEPQTAIIAPLPEQQQRCITGALRKLVENVHPKEVYQSLEPDALLEVSVYV